MYKIKFSLSISCRATPLLADHSPGKTVLAVLATLTDRLQVVLLHFAQLLHCFLYPLHGVVPLVESGVRETERVQLGAH